MPATGPVHLSEQIAECWAVTGRPGLPRQLGAAPASPPP